LCIFEQLFQRIRYQRENSSFYDIFFGLKRKLFWVILAHFENFEAKHAENGSKNVS
jgi:hypothetical protein